ncbi:hypothetical protein ACET3Z_009022 [Daucus carota]
MKLLEPTSPNQAFNEARNHIPTVKSSRKSGLQGKYKIMIVAGNGSESFDFVLQDRAAKRILSKTATKLIADSIQEGLANGIPTKIKEIVGKQLTLKIRIKHDNVLLKSTVLFASDAYEPGVTSSFSIDASTSGATVSSIDESNVVDLEQPGDTPGTSKSSSKKIKLEL